MTRGRPKLFTEEKEDTIIDKYLSGEKVTALAVEYRCSGIGIYCMLKRRGITSGTHCKYEKRVFIDTECSSCGIIFSRDEFQLNRTNTHFCSHACYYKFLRRNQYKESRYGMTLARKEVSKHFTLTGKNVVHHLDGNNHNNDITNLVVFKSQREHVRFHRGFDEKPIWRGDSLTH